mmetsp:Transcript_8009/g.12256  ORF Transcript_8009/g.12256 Transcript_8009/m.12256 type:complete len:80 (+) Transcript_8009:149-388(+)
MNWFGKKKTNEGSTVSASSARPSAASNPQVTIVKLRENIRTQDKRLVLKHNVVFHVSRLVQILYLLDLFKSDDISSHSE